MRLPSPFRALAIAVALVANLAIPGIALAHGYAHLELAHHDDAGHSPRDHDAVNSTDHGREVSSAEHSDAEHEHPDIAATGTQRSSTILAALPVAVADLAVVAAETRAVIPPDRDARARGKPRQTAPPHLRAPPAE